MKQAVKSIGSSATIPPSNGRLLLDPDYIIKVPWDRNGRMYRYTVNKREADLLATENIRIGYYLATCYNVYVSLSEEKFELTYNAFGGWVNDTKGSRLYQKGYKNAKRLAMLYQMNSDLQRWSMNISP